MSKPMNRNSRTPLGLAILAALAACGGGGGDAGAPATPTVATSAFNACYNPALYATGASVRLNYRNPAGDTTIVNSFTVLQGQFFNGVSGLTATSYTSSTSVTSSGAGAGTSAGISYAAIPSAATGIRQYGSVVTQPGASQIIYSPAWDDPTFIFAVGQSTSFSFTGVTSNNGVAGGSFTTSRTLTFIAAEDITTPAGVFKSSCHIRTADATTASGGVKSASTTDDWFAAGTGVLIQESSGGAISYNLVSGTVNGRALP